ncbi:MAG TPA: TM1266 family iron-only hydrogenase system putative regulator [Thermodesulfobacteriota bacterium]|nr:TM1266 family iron-only hydrogenase system putative regulator [Thermodesulfobacteriota bacterium]
MERKGERRLGVVGIVIRDRKTMAPRVNEILTQHADIIAGRMGLPYRSRNVSIISLIIDGTTDDVGSLTGKLGMLQGVEVCSSLVRG